MPFKPQAVNESWFRRPVASLLVLLLFLAFTVYLLHPRSTQMKGYLHAGPDPKVLIWTMSWLHHQLFNDPVHLFRANIFYPHQNALFYSDSLLVQSMMSLPLRALTAEPTVVFNASFIIAFTLSAFGMFLLVRYLTGKTAIAIIAGVFFAFSPYRLDNITHLQYASHQWLPFTVYALFRFFRERKKRWAFAAAAFLALEALSCATYFVMFSISLVLLVLFLWAAYPLDRRSAIWLAIAGICLALFLFPFFYPFWMLTQELGLGPELNQVLVFSPDLLDFAKQPKYLISEPYGILPAHIKTPYFSLFPGFLASAAIIFSFAVLFTSRPGSAAGGGVPRPRSWRVLAVSRWVALSVTGICAVALAAIAFAPPDKPSAAFTPLTALLWILLLAWLGGAFIAAVARRRGSASRDGFLLWGFLSLAVMNALFALGPQIHVRNISIAQNVFWPLHSFVPGFKTIRQVMHFNTIVLLFAVAAAGVALKRVYGLSRLARVALLAGMLAWIGFEYRTDVSRDYVKVPLEVPTMYRWLAEEPDSSPLIELPVWGYPHHQESDRMYWSMYHWKPLVTGQSSYWPVEYERLVEAMRSFPSVESIDYLQENYKLRFLVMRTRHYSLPRLLQGRWLLEAHSPYRLKKRYKYFWLFENMEWDDSLFYTVDPPK